jgi:hypothetical protein
MTRLVIEPEAEEELDEAAVRYEDAVPGLGQQFLAEMRQRVGNVLQMPRVELVSVMGPYAKRRGVSFEVPGRGPAITWEERERAERAVADLSGLAEFLRWTATAARVGKQYLMPSEGTFVLPNGGQIHRPFLQVNIFDGSQRSLVEALAGAAAGPLRAHIGADIQVDDAPGAFTAHVTGPHEILRVFADGDDWWWV